VGEIVTGTVTKITNFGVFVELEEGLEGLLHISELSSRKVNSPEEVVKVGHKVDVRILKIDPNERKIGLSMINVEQPDYGNGEEEKASRHSEEAEPPMAQPEEPAAEAGEPETPAMGDDSAPEPTLEADAPAEEADGAGSDEEKAS